LENEKNIVIGLYSVRKIIHKVLCGAEKETSWLMEILRSFPPS
jgi:hypothetical protein